jgi:hypothetical protein
MATIYPFSNQTAERLREMPGPGGTHKWISQIAGGLHNILDAERSFAILRRCCDEFVLHRKVSDKEIQSAVELTYTRNPRLRINFGRNSVRWPEPNHGLITQTITNTAALFDTDQDTALRAQDVLPHLFRPGELVCTGQSIERALVRPVEKTLGDADTQQFVVLNPMRGAAALNCRGDLSPRCRNNTGLRRHLVAEFDDPQLSKSQQGILIALLATLAPLVLVVDSGGKSLHGWFRVDRLSTRNHVRFFSYACLLGADSSRWDISGWLRMPGGLRQLDGVPSVRQRIVFFNPEATNDQ